MMGAMKHDGEPTVFLIGGASGAGKTRLSYRLARHLGSALIEVDDLVVATRAVTTALDCPGLHHWLTHDSSGLSVDDVVAGQVRVAHALEPAVQAVIENHLETRTPVVIEGDYLLPQARHGVRAVIVHEDDVDQLVANYAAREPGGGEQRQRAQASRDYGRWLADQAAATGAPVLAPRPWPTAFDRLLAAFELAAGDRADD